MKPGRKRSLIQYIAAIATVSLCIWIKGAAAGGPGYSFGDHTSANSLCLSCHAQAGAAKYLDPIKFQQTTHARLGCLSCHGSAGTRHPGDGNAGTTTTCGDCHDDITEQLSRDTHGRKISCGGCHNPHEVFSSDEISADGMNRQCAGCHKDHTITATHAMWLPQAELHLGAVSCVTCHSKAEDYVITIYISGADDEKTEPVAYRELKKLTGEKEPQALLDQDGDDSVSIGELKRFNNDARYRHLLLKGMIKPVKPTHAFQAFDDRWDCTFCHASGQEMMQTSYVAFPLPNGTYRQVAVERGAVLAALETLPNFYLTGSSRNATLNRIGLLIVAGGMVMPIGHGFFRFLTRKFRR